ncbi:MAG: alpha/beta fold hydrolase [Deltaproteobacteria bacterium]|nr:alpha/beta fold hydrolase [Deltaproteobacteria bacterium]
MAKPDYSILDRPEIVSFLFYPRKEGFFSGGEGGKGDILIPVAEDVVIGARFHSAGTSAPTILFFHGNGEIVSDYDDLGPIYVKLGVNFLPVDYRGYGRSTGSPTVSAMMDDCHTIFTYVQDWLKEKGHHGPFIVMGRSLGSISALELASHCWDEIDGLIIESGLAYAIPLLQLLGIDAGHLGISEEDGFSNIEKIETFPKPTLIIHAEHDHIIPFSDGQALFEASPASDKRFLMIHGANHNDIFARGLTDYMNAIGDLLKAVGSISPLL